MKGININCKEKDYLDLILRGIKTIETRNSPSLDPYRGQVVGLIRTGCGKATLVGYARIGKIVRIVDNENTFDNYYQWHQVDRNSKYYINKKKYLYQLYDVKMCEPRIITSRGIISREI